MTHSIRARDILLLSACISGGCLGAAQSGGGAATPPTVDAGVPVTTSDAAAAAPVDLAHAAPAVDGSAPLSQPPRPALAGVVLWLDASSGVTSAQGRVSRWSDSSGAHNDARQPDARYQPTAATGSNQLPALRFTGKPDPKNGGGDGGPYLSITDVASLDWGTGDWSVFVVGSYRNPLDGTHNGALGAFFGRYDVPEILLCGNWTLTETTEQSTLHIGLGEGNAGLESTRKQLNDGVVRLYAGRKAGDMLELRINGASDSRVHGADVLNANVSSNPKNIGIGSFSGDYATRALDGDIEALIAVRGSLSDNELANLETYLMKSYHVTP